MRVEIDGVGAGRAPEARHPPRRPAAARKAWWRLDRFDFFVLLAFGALSVWVLALDLFQVVAHGLVWTGTDGFYLVDQMQYLAWIRDASHHVLASNLFVLRSTPQDYFQPAVLVSGGLSALGVVPWLALLLWKPVAVIAAVYGVRAYVGRNLQGLWPRRVALVLGLFFGSFTIIYGSVGIVGDLFPAFLSWGYTFGLLALAAMLFALVAYDRARSRAGRIAWAPPALSALASSLHPWQGELLILIVIGTELALWRRERRGPRGLVLPAVTVIATGIPLLYYVALGHLDLSWQLARDASKHSFSLATIVLGLVPLLLPALFAVRGAPRTFMATATRAWPLAALVIYVLSASDVSATPLHAFEGISIPLAVLATQGVQRTRLARVPHRRAFAAAAVALLTIPAIWYSLQSARTIVAPAPGNANFITADEGRALSYLAHDRQPGGVLTRFYLGSLIPAETGRRTFVGDCLWSQPGCGPRAQLAQDLFDAAITPARARMFVTNTGARFVLADCDTTADVRSILAPMLESVHRFGCAAVYVLASPASPRGPLAESPSDAAVRASGRQQRRVQSS